LKESMSSHTRPPERPAAAGGRALVFVLLTVMLDAMGNGILIPVIPELIIKLRGTDLGQSAVYGGWLMATFAIVQFIASPMLGSLSDSIGRRPVLLVSLAAYGLSYLVMGFAPTLAWLFFAQVLTGLFGATPSTAGAYLADISAPHERTARFGMLGASYGLGLIIGPVVGGLLVEHGLVAPFLAAAGLSLANVAYGTWVLPESLPMAARRKFSWARANPIGVLKELQHMPRVARLLLVTLLQRIAANTLPATWPFFAMMSFKWSPREVGWSLAAFGTTTVLTQAVFVRQFERWLGTRGLTMAGILLMIVGYAGLALVPVSMLQMLCIPLAALGFAALAGLSSLLSQSVGGDQQGWVQGAMASANGIAAVCAPLLMTWLFGYFTTAGAPFQFPGAPYLAGLVLAAMGLALLLGRKAR
jgi:DHA1 family tetracycline resistance protein-like MFS transporter